MSIPLNPDENVYYPMPYIEGEPHLLVITSQRVVHFGAAGKQEMPAKQIQFVGRVSTRPFVVLGVVLGLAALAMVGVGVYFIATSGILSGARAALPAGPAADDPSVAAPAAGDPAAESDDPSGAAAPAASGGSGAGKVLGLVMTPIGLILLVVGGLLLRVQRHFVLLRGGQMAMEIRTKTPMEQTQVLATVGALQSSAKTAGPAPAAPKPQVKVDDKGDPVKALQELQTQRQAGKISEEDFDAKREVLLARVRAKK